MLNAHQPIKQINRETVNVLADELLDLIFGPETDASDNPTMTPTKEHLRKRFRERLSSEFGIKPHKLYGVQFTFRSPDEDLASITYRVKKVLASLPTPGNSNTEDLRNFKITVIE